MGMVKWWMSVIRKEQQQFSLRRQMEKIPLKGQVTFFFYSRTLRPKHTKFMQQNKVSGVLRFFIMILPRKSFRGSLQILVHKFRSGGTPRTDIFSQRWSVLVSDDRLVLVVKFGPTVSSDVFQDLLGESDYLLLIENPKRIRENLFAQILSPNLVTHIHHSVPYNRGKIHSSYFIIRNDSSSPQL